MAADHRKKSRSDVVAEMASGLDVGRRRHRRVPSSRAVLRVVQDRVPEQEGYQGREFVRIHQRARYTDVSLCVTTTTTKFV